MKNLKQRWAIKSNWSVIAIIVVFAINGSFATWIANPFTNFLGLYSKTTSFWIYWILKILLILPIYQITLPIIGWVFGEFNFFWEFEKRFLKSLGLGFLLKKNKI